MKIANTMPVRPRELLWKRPLAPSSIGFLFIIIFLLSPVQAEASTLRILNASYRQHFTPGEPMLFRVMVQNLEPTAQGVELLVILTNLSTGAATVPLDVGTPGTIAAGSVFTFTPSTTAEPGIYTVAFRILDGDGIRSDQITGQYPIHVGTQGDTLHVFPDALHLGTLLPGRHMHPVPLEIRWNFYRFNELRLDQPFSIRLYTDNAARYRGISGAIRQSSPAGLLSENGRYTVPLKIWSSNFGPDIQETGWSGDLAGPPPVDDDTFWKGPLLADGDREYGAVAWLRVPDLSEMSSDPGSWRRIIGQDPFDSRFVSDTNKTGDFTLPSPVTVYVATETGASSVQGNYSTTLVVELYSP